MERSSHCKVVVLEGYIETTKDVIMSGEENVGPSDLYGSHSLVLIIKLTESILSRTTQVYFNSKCVYMRALYVSVCTEVIIRHFNTKISKGRYL